MRSYTETKPKFSDNIQITETSDPAHADVINAAPMQLLQNTIVNKQGIEQLEEPDFEEPQEETDPEDAINQIRPKKHPLLLYKYIKAALRGSLAVAKKALNIATGKNQARVFATVADLDAWLEVQDNVKKLNVGDNFYIVATDVPDYWWDGTAKQEVEVQKIDLTTYDNAITALQNKDEELKQSLDNTVLKALSTNNYIDVLTSINQITSIGFWKIENIDGSYAQSIGIRTADNVGDFYALVSNYNGDGSRFNYGNLQLFSPRLGVNYFTIQVWGGVATAKCMITHDNLLNTTEQISANTESFYAAGALAVKAMMADYNNKINQINSNMACKKIEVESNFASEIKVWRIGNVVSVDIDGYIIAPVNTIFATGFPIPIFVIWVQDLAGHHFRLYNGNLKCNMELNGKEYTNLHFTYLCV